MICKKCGCRVSDTAAFCDKCGAPMAEFGMPEDSGLQGTENIEKAARKKPSKKIIVFIVLAVIVVIGVLYYIGKRADNGLTAINKLTPYMTEDKVCDILSEYDPVMYKGTAYAKNYELAGQKGTLALDFGDDGLKGIVWFTKGDEITDVKTFLEKEYGKTNISGYDDYVYVRKADNTNGWIVVLNQTGSNTVVGWVADA